MRNVCMTVAYDGTAYFGFQSQPGANTIQDHIEAALKLLTGEVIKVTSSGRTDAGVHARAQVINFYTESQIPIERWCVALNSRLPRDILFTSAREVSTSFHARRSAVQKTYRYSIRCGRLIQLFSRQTEFHHPARLDTAAMRDAIQYVVGTHDFTSFCATRTSSKKTTVRTVLSASVTVEEQFIDRQPSQLIQIEITGTGFLHNMVRIIVGTLLEIGENKRAAADMRTILEARNRRMAGPTAMAHGLMLWEVLYAE